LPLTVYMRSSANFRLFCLKARTRPLIRCRAQHRS